MFSINGGKRVDALFDRLEIALTRCLDLPFDELTTAELQAVLECFELISGRLAALEYELTSPFHHPKNLRRDPEDDECDGAA